MDPKNPEGLDEVNSLKPTQKIKDFTDDLSHLIEEGKNHRNDWNTRHDMWTRKRYGVRGKKSFPWVGSANFILPQIDSDINRLKPAYINLGFGVSPIVSFVPFSAADIEPARKREQLFDWRMQNQVQLFKDYALGVDYMLHAGWTVFKTGWIFETTTYTEIFDLTEIEPEILDALYMPETTDEMLMQIFAEEFRPDLSFQENIDAIKKVVYDFREGKTKFKVQFVEKNENRAEVTALNPREDVFFPVDTTDIQQADYVMHRYPITKNTLKKGMKNKKYIKYSDDDISHMVSKSTMSTAPDYLKRVRDGVITTNASNDDIIINEVSTWYDVDGDGIEERVILTFPENNPSMILRFIEIPYDHGEFPYVAVRRELNDATIMSSRGIAALDDDFQTGISTLFNQDIDAGTITTTPTVVARKNSVKNLRNLRYVPGQVVETENGAADYNVVQNHNLGQTSKLNSMQYLKSWANDRIGNMTAAISQSNNAPGGGDKGNKTAREVGAIESGSAQIQSMDLQVFQQQMASLYSQLDSLYHQFGDEEETIMVGQEPTQISREETRGKFRIVPNGRLDNSNPVARLQKTMNMWQMFQGNPMIRQDQLLKLVIDDYDVRMGQVLLKTKQEMQQDQQQAIEAQNDSLRTAISMQTAKSNIKIREAAALAPIEGKKYAEG